MAAFALALGAVPACAFELQGHRGARGLAPENTLAAFERALGVGVDVLELDLQVTQDDAIVVSHDTRLPPEFTRDASGRWVAPPGPAIRALTLSQLQTYDVGRAQPGSPYAGRWPDQRGRDGERVPTLEAVFALLARRGASNVRLNIEVKLAPADTPALVPPPDAFVERLVALLRRAGMERRVTVQSFNWAVLQQMRRQAPDIATVALSARQKFLNNVDDPAWSGGLRLEDHAGSVPKMARAAGARVWSPYHGDLTRALLDEARALGMPVVPWTVNDEPTMQRLIDWGVDGLITDYPDRLRQVMAARGMPLPPTH